MDCCEWCDTRLPAGSRSHRRYCSDSHRAMASQARRRLAMHRDYARFVAFVAEVGTPEQREAFAAMTSTIELADAMAEALAAGRAVQGDEDE